MATCGKYTSILPPLPEVDGEIRHVPDYPGYAVTDRGEVWSCRNWHKPTEVGDFRITWRKLKPSKSQGYPDLVICIHNKRKTVKVHHLVLLAFVGPKPDGMETLHRDGNKSNANLSNLHYGTREENIEDKKRHGTSGLGRRSGNAKLKDEDIPKIVEMYKTMYAGDVAKHFGVSGGAITSIARGNGYTDVKRPIVIKPCGTRGTKQWAAKLNEDDVREIRRLAGTMSQEKIGKLFSVTQTVVSSILLRKTWKHVA